MKSTRKMFALVLALVMCLALFPASASAAASEAAGTGGAEAPAPLSAAAFSAWQPVKRHMTRISAVMTKNLFIFFSFLLPAFGGNLLRSDPDDFLCLQYMTAFAAMCLL